MMLASSNIINDLISGDISKERNCKNDKCLSGLFKKIFISSQLGILQPLTSPTLCFIFRESS